MGLSITVMYTSPRSLQAVADLPRLMHDCTTAKPHMLHCRMVPHRSHVAGACGFQPVPRHKINGCTQAVRVATPTGHHVYVSQSKAVLLGLYMSLAVYRPTTMPIINRSQADVYSNR